MEEGADLRLCEAEVKVRWWLGDYCTEGNTTAYIIMELE